MRGSRPRALQSDSLGSESQRLSHWLFVSCCWSHRLSLVPYVMTNNNPHPQGRRSKYNMSQSLAWVFGVLVKTDPNPSTPFRLQTDVNQDGGDQSAGFIAD